MATLEQLESALVKADKAGDMDAARKLAAVVAEARGSMANQIPGLAVPGAPTPDATLGEKVIGSGEAGLTAVTGATTGLAGRVGGTVVGIGKSIAARENPFSPQAAKTVEESAQAGANALTYQPRTESGQEQASALGRAAGSLPPILGMGTELAGLQNALKPAAMQAVQAVKSGTGKLGEIGAQLAERIPTKSTSAASAITEPLPGSVGSAAVNPIQQARALVSKASPELQAAVEETIKRSEPLNMKAIENYVEAETLPVPIRYSRGQAMEDAIIISEEQNARGRSPEIVAGFNEANKGLIDNVNAIKEKVAPDVYLQNPTEHGDIVISAYQKLDDDLQTQVRANYKALEDANGGKFPMNTQAFVKTAEENLNKANRNHYLPAEIRNIIGQYKDGLPMDFNGFEELRTILADDMRSASNGNVRKAIGAVRQALEDLPLEKGSEQLKELADIARSSAKQRFDLIKADPAFKSVVDGKALPDNFINKHVIAADSTRLETMLRNLNLVDPDLRQVLASAAMNHFKGAAKVGNDAGTFAASSFNNALNKFGPKANLLFGEEGAATMRQLGNVAQKLKQQPSGSFVNNSNTATALIAEGAKSGVEGVANLAGFGIIKPGSSVRKLLEARSAKKEFSKTFEPGAGVSAKESKLLEVKRKVQEAKAKKQKP